MKTKHIRVALVASGELRASERLIARIRSFSYIIAVDGGADHCWTMGITPDLLVGDFDSITLSAMQEFPNVQRITLPQDKDETDLEVALNQVDIEHCQEVVIFGGLGHRIDHTLFNVILLSRYPGKLQIESDEETLFVISAKQSISTNKDQLISLIPLNGPVTGIKTHGLKWELNQGKMDKQFVGISNVSLGEKVTISVESGDLLCVLGRDPLSPSFVPGAKGLD
jgi:thiamine pyrophosphokinase